MASIGNVARIDAREYGRPPTPTVEQPFAQIEWIFGRRQLRAPSASTRSNYRQAKYFYMRHIESVEGRNPYLLAERWDEFALLKLKASIQDRIDAGDLQLSSHTLTGHFSAIRQVMKEAAAYGLLATREIQETSWATASSSTDTHASYSEAELSQILSAVAQELRYAYVVAAGYTSQSTELGRDPRVNPKRGRTNGYGFGCEANMRWYFEHVLHCKPIVGYGPSKNQHARFFNAAHEYHGGLHNLYRRWGVAAIPDDNLIMPLAINLLYLTGLNPSSLLKLRVDCLHDEHPLTGMPYLLFEKERSNGEKELHLPLLDKREERGLKRKQTLQVKRAISTVLQLTETIRARLPSTDPLRNLLFVHGSTGPNAYNRTLPLTPGRTSAWCKRIVKKYDLHSENGGPLNLNLVRFRSTKLTQMALEGRDFFEIQQVARHKSIAQTVRYIAANRLDEPARVVVSTALAQIRANHTDVVKAASNSDSASSPPFHLFKGLVADCKNVFDPPDRVRRAVDHVPGQPCTRVNMCLFCRNVVVMKEHLPALAAYRAQIMTAQANNIQNLPHAHIYNQTLSILDNLFDPSVSQFSLDEIEWALDASIDVDIVIDPLLYQGTHQ